MFIYLILVNTNTGDNMKYYIDVFIIYSIIGFIIETILKLTLFPSINNGFLYGPWIPVYGFGCCLIIVIMRFVFNKIKLARFLKIILLFLISAIILTLLEYIGGNLIELFTDKVFWDYSNMKYNLGHYVALEISLLWGMMSVVFVYIIKPFTDKLIKKIPGSLTYLVLSIVLFDFLITVI